MITTIWTYHNACWMWFRCSRWSARMFNYLLQNQGQSQLTSSQVLTKCNLREELPEMTQGWSVETLVEDNELGLLMPQIKGNCYFTIREDKTICLKLMKMTLQTLAVELATQHHQLLAIHWSDLTKIDVNRWIWLSRMEVLLSKALKIELTCIPKSKHWSNTIWTPLKEIAR